LSVDEKLKIVNGTFRKGSKSFKAARYIVRQDHEISDEEKVAICQEIPISPKTLEGVLTKLRQLGLYATDDIPLDLYKDTEIEEDEIEPTQEQFYRPEIPQQNNYVTIEDFARLREELNANIKYLAAVVNGDPIEEQEYEEEIPQVDYELPPQPDEMAIQDPTLMRKSIWIKPKTSMYYDLTRQGIFTHYSDTNEPSPLLGFKGNLSDFFYIVVDDYFIRNFNADIGILMRRYIK